MAMSCDVIVLFCVVLDDCKRDSLVANMATAFGLWKQEQKVTRHSREQAKRLQVPMHPIWAADPGNESCATSSGCVCESDEISCNNPDREGEVFCCSFAMPSSCYDDGYQPWYRSIMCIYIYTYTYIYIYTVFVMVRRFQESATTPAKRKHCEAKLGFTLLGLFGPGYVKRTLR